MANNNYVCTINAEQAAELRVILENSGWEFSTLPYAKFKAAKDHTTIAAYESGKLVVQGRGTEEFVLYTLEPEILHTFTYGYEDVVDPVKPETVFEITPHGGIDESGKGDFFGPLVIAGVCIDENTGRELQKLGVCDSKLIHSSARITKLAEAIRSIAAGHYSSVVLMPETFGLTMGSAMIIAFVLIAVWWIACTVPLAKKYRQTAFVAETKTSVWDAFR